MSLAFGAPRAPAVLSVSVTPGVLPARGGTVTISGRVAAAGSCTLLDGAAAVSVDCASGRLSLKRRFGANPRARADVHRVVLVARDGAHTARSRTLRLLVMGARVLPAPVAGVQACSPGPQCDYGAAEEVFQSWGNTPGGDVSDCTFAAAADWEQVVLGWYAYPSVIAEEFARAGGNPQSGLEQGALWSYWRREGIAGSYLQQLDSYSTDAASVRRALRARRALIAQLHLRGAWQLGPYLGQDGYHDVLVVGFTPAGPLLVSWGAVLQMSWGQWREDALGVWGLTASDPA